MAKNLVYVVTGAASGMGKACVEHFSAVWGDKIDIVALDLAKADDVPPEVKSKADYFTADVSSEQDIQAVADHIAQKYGRCDVIINCAGIALGGAVYNFTTNEPHDLAAFSRVIQINTVGTFNVIRLMLPIMARNTPDSDGQKGVIINVSSVLGFEANPGQTAYAASKAAVAGMTLPLAREFAPQGIRVVAVAPGFVDTPMVRNVKGYEALLSALQVFPQRMVAPLEFAKFCQSIVENHALNGEVIRLDAGVRIALPKNFNPQATPAERP